MTMKHLTNFEKFNESEMNEGYIFEYIDGKLIHKED